MPERWVVNASPLIVLAKIQQQALLAQLADSLLIPQAVVDEIDAGPPDDPARLFLSAQPLPVVTVALDPTVLAWDLGAGETAVLSYALHNPGWKAVLDDAMARRCGPHTGHPAAGHAGRDPTRPPGRADLCRSPTAQGAPGCRLSPR